MDGIPRRAQSAKGTRNNGWHFSLGAHRAPLQFLTAHDPSGIQNVTVSILKRRTSRMSQPATRWDSSYEWKAVLLLGFGFGLVGLDRWIIAPLFPCMAAAGIAPGC